MVVLVVLVVSCRVSCAGLCCSSCGFSTRRSAGTTCCGTGGVVVEVLGDSGTWSVGDFESLL